MQAREHWRDLASVKVRFRAGFAYIDGDVSDGPTIPLCRLRYGGSSHRWGEIAAFQATPLGKALMQTGLRQDLPEYDAAREAFWRARQGWHRCAEARRGPGKLRSDVDLRLAFELMVGLLILRTFLTREATDDEVLEKTVDLVLAAISAARPQLRFRQAYIDAGMPAPGSTTPSTGGRDVASAPPARRITADGRPGRAGGSAGPRPQVPGSRDQRLPGCATPPHGE